LIPAAAAKSLGFNPADALGGEFLVRDALGRPRATFAWSRAVVGSLNAAPLRPAHHVFVVDRSGSMYGEIAGVRDLVRRLLAVEEYRRPGLLVSIVSYSSQGSDRVHVERQPVEALGERTSLDKLQADGLTCMSDGLTRALALVREGERTTVTVHSDGYVNDPDPSSDRRAVADLCARLRAGGAVVNTVAHRRSSDFGLLSQVANSGGGSCVQAGDLAGVYDALVMAHSAAAGPQGMGLYAPAGAEWALRVRASSRRVLLSRVGVHPSSRYLADVAADEEVYFLTEKASPAGSFASMPLENSLPVALAFARGLVGAGLHSLAKGAAVSTGYEVLRKHARALTGPQVAALASDLDDLLFGDSGSDSPLWRRAARGPVAPQPEPRATLPELLAVLGGAPGAVKVFLPGLLNGYVRRGLKRVPGKWEHGQVVEPAVVALKRRGGTGADGWVDLMSVDQNDSEATVNVTLSEPIDLARRPSAAAGIVSRGAQPERLAEVAGVSLEGLRQFRSFTVVGDGEVCVKTLPCRVTDRALHARLRALGALPQAPGFNPTNPVYLDLDLPLLRSAAAPACPSAADVARALRLTVLQRLLSASLRGGQASKYSPEQLAALQAVHVTPALNFSPPTCYPYADLRAAQAAGKVDSRTRYRVVFGALSVQPGDLPSGNEYVARRYVVEGAAEPDKPTAADFFNPVPRVREKTAAEARRLKLGPVDALCAPIYALAAARASGKPWPRHAIAVDSCGIDTSASITTSNLASESPSRGVGSAELGLPAEFGTGGSWASPVARLADLARVETALEALRARLREVVMAVGACGQVPDEWGPPVDAVDVEKAGFKLSKGDRNGSFRLCGGVLAGVVPVEALYSVSYESSFDAT
jgi:Mg-chelatase subunit ChlD